MVVQKPEISHPDRSAGWVVVAIVAVIAICAVSFMVTQRPREALAVAEGDTLTGEMLRGPQPAPAQPPVRARAAIDSQAATRAGAKAAAAAEQAANSADAIPAAALDANAAASNASAIESAR